MDFIPAKESRLTLWFFDWYTRFMIWRRFKKVIINQEYTPSNNSRTVYFMNHNYWWDGLLPLYLNRTRFKQKARALMEDKQMRQYPFFARIGAFSINLEDPRSSLRSLRYAVDSMKRERSCLFIYPEGKLSPVDTSKPDFKEGLAWIYQKVDDVDFVPIAFYIDHSKANKPDLHISIGNSVDHDKYLSRNELTDFFENDIHHLITELKKEIQN